MGEIVSMADMVQKVQQRQQQWQNGKSESTPELLCEFCGAQRYWDGDVHRDCRCPEAKEKEKQIKKEKLFRDRQEKARLPMRYRGSIFEAAKITNNNRDAYAKAREYCEQFTFIPNPTSTYNRYDKTYGNKIILPEKSLFITGEAGEGKTYLAAVCCNELIGKKIGVTFGNVISLLGRIKSTYNNDSDESENEAIDELTNVDLLILDDLGKEKVTQWTEQMLYYVINNRYENLKPMIITSNFNLTDLKKRYEVGPYIVSRLVEICDGLRMVGDNWRKR